MAKRHVKVLPNTQEYLDFVAEYCADYDFYGNFIAVYFENEGAKRSFLQLLVQYRFSNYTHGTPLLVLQED